MTRPIPKWLTIRYALLWKRKGEKKFDFEDSQKILGEKDGRTLSVVLSNLRKHGWLDVEINPQNTRKRRYHLKSPKKIIEEIAGEKTRR